MNALKPLPLEPFEAVSELAVDQAVLGQRYRLERLLGVGSTGPVWLAEDLELRVPRALKFLSDLAPDELEDLKAETLRCQELTHQGIVRIYDFVRDDEHAAICMEAINGPDLRAAQRERTPACFHPDEIVFWMEGLCRALHHAHTFAKVIHRDLKPSNLLINRRGYLKVADFGIAKAIPKRLVHQEDHPKIAGTLEYISPQQLEGMAPAVADDIYSFGATLFELLAGRPPFVGDDLYEQVLHRDAPSVSETRQSLFGDLPTVSKDWEDVIDACLSKNPADRPKSVREVANQLDLELRQLTIREPVLPEGFLGEGAADPEAPLTQDRRVRTLQDVPIGGDSNLRARLPWMAGAGGVLVVLGLAFCRPADKVLEETEQAVVPEVPTQPAVVPAAMVEEKRSPQNEHAPDLSFLETGLRGSDWTTVQMEVDRLRADGHGDLPIVLLGEARLHLSRKALPDALAALRGLLEIEPTHAEGTRLKAVTHAALKEWQAVRPAVSWAIAQADNAPVAAELYILRGRANRKLGHLDLAKGDFDQAIEMRPNDAAGYYQRGLAYREEGKLQSATQDLTTAIQHDPQHVLARSARARLLLQDGQFEPSVGMIVEDLSYAINANPDDVDARLDRLRCYDHLQQWDGVMDDSKALLAREPKLVEVQHLWATASIKSGRYEGVSLDDMRHYAEQFPNDLNHWYHLAEKCLADSRFTDAKDAFAEIIRRDSSPAEAHEGRAFAYYSIAKELAAANKQPKLRHHQRLLGIADINTFLSQAGDKATADSYLLKVKLQFYRGDYGDANVTAREGRKRFPASKQEFDWWIDEIKVANGLEKRKARGRPDRPNWFERFFKRNRRQ